MNSLKKKSLVQFENYYYLEGKKVHSNSARIGEVGTGHGARV